jgi:hypothetical protein
MARKPREPKASGIEASLAAVHKSIAQSGYAVSSMLARRRMNLTTLAGAAAQLKSASAEFEIILEQLKRET